MRADARARVGAARVAASRCTRVRTLAALRSRCPLPPPLLLLAGFSSLRSRLFLPLWLLIPLAAAAELLGWLSGRTPKLNRFNVKVLTMNRWFLIGAAERDLGYQVSGESVGEGEGRGRVCAVTEGVRELGRGANTCAPHRARSVAA